MLMTQSQKLKDIQKQLVDLGVSPSAAAPPIWRLLWRLGIDIPPPLFMTFWASALFMGTLFGVLWGLFMWFVFWNRQSMSIELAIGVAAFSGVLFGLGMATYYRNLAKKHKLPAWAGYHDQHP